MLIKDATKHLGKYGIIEMIYNVYLKKAAIFNLQVNCSCILVSNGFLEVINETNLFISGMKIPLELFSQQEVGQKQRRILDARLMDLLPLDASLDLSPYIFVDMHIDEHFLLFTCNRSVLVDVFSALSHSEVRYFKFY
uniref:Uncharacterized protein n=1 Tax=Parascaris univalens TaxID=6257 RepID=A0A915AZ96_PARUN